MKALTLHQPWASLVPLGFKTIETRSWATRHRGPIAIHAAARVPSWARPLNIGGFEVDQDNPPGTAPAYLLRGPINWPYRLPLGCVVATADLVDCVPIHEWLCSCDHADGIYAGVGPTSMQRGDIVGLFEAPSGKGVEHPDWAPSRLDTLAAEQPRQQAPFGDFRCGRWAWLLGDIKRCDPIPAKGKQGLWNWEPDR